MKKVWIVIISVVVVAVVVGAGTYYFTNRAAQTEKENLRNQINELQSQEDESQAEETTGINEVLGDDSTADWQTYKNTELGYQCKYPSNFEMIDQGDYSVMISKETDELTGPFNDSFYITVIPDSLSEKDADAYGYNYLTDSVNEMLALDIKESKVIGSAKTMYDEWYTYKRLANKSIDGEEAIVILNNKPWESPANQSDKRCLINKSNRLYMIGALYGSDISSDMLGNFLSTIEFTD